MNFYLITRKLLNDNIFHTILFSCCTEQKNVVFFFFEKGVSNNDCDMQIICIYSLLTQYSSQLASIATVIYLQLYTRHQASLSVYKHSLQPVTNIYKEKLKTTINNLTIKVHLIEKFYVWINLHLDLKYILIFHDPVCHVSS